MADNIAKYGLLSDRFKTFDELHDFKMWRLHISGTLTEMAYQKMLKETKESLNKLEKILKNGKE